MSNDDKTAQQLLDDWIAADDVDVKTYNNTPHRPLEVQVDFLSFRLSKAMAVLAALTQKIIDEQERAKRGN